MTSATIRQARGASRGEGYWMIVFAVALMIIAIDVVALWGTVRLRKP
jgi:hypothetical protein